MSNYQQRDNSGQLFRNEGERKTEKGPDYSGTCMVSGVEMYFDGWLKTAESGRKWMSFSFKNKQPQQAQAPAPRQQPQQQGRSRLEDMDDSQIPF